MRSTNITMPGSGTISQARSTTTSSPSSFWRTKAALSICCETSRTSADITATLIRPPSRGRLPPSRSSSEPSRISKARSRVWSFTKPTPTPAARDFADLAEALNNSALRFDQPTNRALIVALNLPRHQSCFTQTGNGRKLTTKGKWDRAAAAAGRPKAEGVEAYDAANAQYEACHEAFERLMAGVAGELLKRVAAAMDGLLDDWRAYKHAAALLDFDDLLYTARNLLAGHEQVRQALARRFQHVLVDEFQDTDPLQIEILWRLCGEAQKDCGADPLARALRPGALFLVGDPKQAIYRFRGADVNAYIGARTAIGDECLLKITANFRSVEPILDFVNNKFETVLSTAAGQPGFTELSPTCRAQRDMLAVAALDVADGDDAKADQMRDAEADRVADLCSRLVGNRLVRDKDKERHDVMRPCRLGDIALLAPVGTELWRFEQALEDRGVAVSTQAGKGFFRRQEIQDLIALTRTLADGRDTLALGALLRGPLVGLTEAELLDVAEALPIDQDRPERLPQLNLWTDHEHIRHDLARVVVRSLQSLAMRARSSDSLCASLRCRLRPERSFAAWSAFQGRRRSRARQHGRLSRNVARL